MTSHTITGPDRRPAATADEPDARIAGNAQAPGDGARANGGRRTPQPGALLAVCGLCGGAGASTLSYLIARFAAEQASADVLVCDTGGPTGGLAAYAAAES